MFSVIHTEDKNFQKIILQDEISGCNAAIVPECSAMLQSFTALNGNERLNVIKSYESFDDFKKNVTIKGFLGCKLSPYVCRISNATYSFGGEKYNLTKNNFSGAALHGQLYDHAFKVTGDGYDDESAYVTMEYNYDHEDPGYPFRYTCRVTWRLEKENRLTVTTECINNDEGLIPMQDGWHPYFTLGNTIDELQLEFQSTYRIEFNDELIPTGDKTAYTQFNALKIIGPEFFDNCFQLDTNNCQPLCVLRHPEKKIQLEIYPGDGYPLLQIYTPKDRQSIALENISGPPDAFNNQMGYDTLEPGQEKQYEVTYKISFLK